MNADKSADNSTGKLVRMANQVAAFFRAYPEEEAISGIRDHIVSFWTPRMRETLLARVERDGPELDPLAARALQALRKTHGPIETTAGSEEVGQSGSEPAEQSRRT